MIAKACQAPRVSASPLSTATGKAREPSNVTRRAVKTITAWAHANGLDAVIWTALAGNFAEKTGEPFSVEAAIRYLETRNGKTFDDALAYIRRAPPEVQTPVREAVNIRWPEATTLW